MEKIGFVNLVTAKLIKITAPVIFFTAITLAASDSIKWSSTIFGQSAGSDYNSIKIDNTSKKVTLTAGTSDGKNIGGKVASGHDGISYYYVELNSSKNFVLTGKVQVHFFAKAIPDNQESFGIMARDRIGKNLDSDVFPSNMVLVGGYRGEIQSMYRDSVTDTTGKGAKRLGRYPFCARPTNDGNAVYTLTMKKTNTGYHVSVNDNEEKIYYRPKLCEVLDTNKVYVGFFAARVASITVSDIVLKTSDVTTDPPGEPEPKEIFIPKDSLISPTSWYDSKYNFSILTNSAGKLLISLNGVETAGEVTKPKIDQPGIFTKTFDLAKDTNIFDIKFVADSAPIVTAMSRYLVTYRKYGIENGTIYVSPAGSGSATGTESDPIDIYSAFEFLQPGQTVIIAEGTYKMFRQLLIERGKDGTVSRLKAVKGVGNVIFDFGNISTGVAIWANYWKLSGIKITRSLDCGMRIFGSNNVFERITTYVNKNTGLQVTGISIEDRKFWPVNNLVLNCESYDNKDPSENDADGFAAKLTVGEGNVFRGCIAHHNCDDGWDLYAKLETGPIGVVTVENCISYGNGSLSNGARTKGDGNGYKLGGEGIAVKHVLRNSIAFNNNAMGVSNNSNPAIVVENTTSIDNGKANYNFGIYTNANPQFTANNNVSFRTADGVSDLDVNHVGSATNYFYLQNTCKNSEGKKIKADDFTSLKPEEFKRKPDGTFEPFSFLALKKNEEKIGAFLDDYSRITTTPAAK